MFLRIIICEVTEYVFSCAMQDRNNEISEIFSYLLIIGYGCLWLWAPWDELEVGTYTSVDKGQQIQILLDINTALLSAPPEVLRFTIYK